MTTKRNNNNRKNLARRPKKTKTVNVKKTFEETFLEKLKSQVSSNTQLISNRTLMNLLKWPKERYIRIRNQLKEQGQIITGRGQGGTIGCSNQETATPLQIFISYCHDDEERKEELIKHIQPLKHLGLISEWHDRKILPGDNIDSTIKKEIESADVILLLVSVDYLNSHYCLEVELENAIERQSKGKCRVIPIILKDCLWKFAKFSNLLALPTDGRPVERWEHKDECLTSIAEGIKLVANEMLENR